MHFWHNFFFFEIYVMSLLVNSSVPVWIVGFDNAVSFCKMVPSGEAGWREPTWHLCTILCNCLFQSKLKVRPAAPKFNQSDTVKTWRQSLTVWSRPSSWKGLQILEDFALLSASGPSSFPRERVLDPTAEVQAVAPPAQSGRSHRGCTLPPHQLTSTYTGRRCPRCWPAHRDPKTPRSRTPCAGSHAGRGCSAGRCPAGGKVGTGPRPAPAALPSGPVPRPAPWAPRPRRTAGTGHARRQSRCPCRLRWPASRGWRRTWPGPGCELSVESWGWCESCVERAGR